MEKIKIETEYIKLDQLLKWAGVIGSGSDAKLVIMDGLVKVNGNIVNQRGKKIFRGDKIKIHLDDIIEFIIE